MNLKEIEELATKLNRHPSTVYRWIHGSRRISKEDAVALEQITGIDRRAWLWPDEFPNPMLQKPEAVQLMDQKAVNS